MGHDIFARQIIVKDDIAYLRRSMGSDTIHLLYEVLGVPQLNSGVSGDGSGHTFTKYIIDRAYAEIRDSKKLDEEDKTDYLEFLKKIQEEIGDDEEKEILIDFH